MIYYSNYNNYCPMRNDELSLHLPPYQVQQVFRAMGETIDWGLQFFRIPELWKHSKGRGIRVAVLDTGIDFEHPELRDAIIDARDFTNSLSGPKDVQGHGTHVAGIIAARQNNAGITGVAPESNLLIGKVLGDNGSGSANALVQGIYWAIKNNAHIISMSLGGSMYSAEIHQAMKDAVHAGIFIICAAGNDTHMDTVNFPAFLREAVSVGALNRNGKVTQFSSKGYQVDIMAPGEDILSTFPPSSYASLSGTSMATPFITGVVALMLAKHRDIGGQTPIRNQMELIQHLRKTAIDGGNIGYDPQYGFGLVNPEKILELHENFVADTMPRTNYATTNVPSYLRETYSPVQIPAQPSRILSY